MKYDDLITEVEDELKMDEIRAAKMELKSRLREINALKMALEKAEAQLERLLQKSI